MGDEDYILDTFKKKNVLNISIVIGQYRLSEKIISENIKFIIDNNLISELILNQSLSDDLIEYIFLNIKNNSTKGKIFDTQLGIKIDTLHKLMGKMNKTQAITSLMWQDVDKEFIDYVSNKFKLGKSFVEYINSRNINKTNVRPWEKIKLINDYLINSEGYSKDNFIDFDYFIGFVDIDKNNIISSNSYENSYNKVIIGKEINSGSRCFNKQFIFVNDDNVFYNNNILMCKIKYKDLVGRILNIKTKAITPIKIVRYKFNDKFKKYL